MIDPDLFAQLKHRIAKRRIALVEIVLRGSCSDYTDYRARTARMAGLDDAFTEIETLERELTDDDDDDD